MALVIRVVGASASQVVLTDKPKPDLRARLAGVKPDPSALLLYPAGVLVSYPRWVAVGLAAVVFRWEGNGVPATI